MRIEADDPRVTDVTRRPYLRMAEPDETGAYTATILEFPGCIAGGETAAAAMESLDELFPEFVASRLENGQSIPEPVRAGDYSGRVTIRIPPSLHQAAARRAAVEGVSLNRFLSEAIAREVGA